MGKETICQLKYRRAKLWNKSTFDQREAHNVLKAAYEQDQQTYEIFGNELTIVLTKSQNDLTVRSRK
jgi:hypothetical protein